MSIIHKALKKAENAEKTAALPEKRLPSRQAVTKNQSPKRFAVIFVIFFILLAVAYYFPVYYKKRVIQKVKQSITIKPGETITVNEDDLLTKGIPVDSAKLAKESVLELNKSGIYYYNIGNAKKAHKFFTAALSKDKDNPVIYNNLGITLKRQKNIRKR